LTNSLCVCHKAQQFRSGMRDTISPVTFGAKESAMLDLGFLALTAGFFGLTYLFIVGLDRLKGGDS
jgi:hypothetical protein